jgi:hypothetical protein
MYWLDGSARLPFVPHCSYLMSSSRAKKFALAQDLIENQARIVKSLVKIGDFDHWCIEASELVDLVVDLVWRGEKYLHQDGLSTRDESLRQISNLNSQFVNFVCFSVFELACKRLSPPSRMSRRALTNNSVLTPTTPCNNNLLLRDGPNRAELTSFSSAQPPPTTTTTTTSPPRVRWPQKGDVTPERREEKGIGREERREGEKKGMCNPSKPTPPPPLTPERQQDAPTAPHPHQRQKW